MRYDDLWKPVVKSRTLRYDAVRKPAVPKQKKRAPKCEPDMVELHSRAMTDACWEHYAKPFTGL
jgi:hypothetical protein